MTVLEEIAVDATVEMLEEIRGTVQVLRPHVLVVDSLFRMAQDLLQVGQEIARWLDQFGHGDLLHRIGPFARDLLRNMQAQEGPDFQPGEEPFGNAVVFMQRHQDIVLGLEQIPGAMLRDHFPLLKARVDAYLMSFPVVARAPGPGFVEWGRQLRLQPPAE